MCQAIAKPAGVNIFRRTLAKAWSSNPDGGGYAYINKADGRVWFQKGFRNFDEFWRAYRVVADGDVLIHFRLATHGAKSHDNCHPFAVGEDLVMAHNGIFSDYLPGHKDDRSDTRIFLEKVLQPAMNAMPEGQDFLTPGVVHLLKEMVGYNRLVFLSPKGFTIVNEQQGEWADGTWFSSGDPNTYRSYVSAWGDSANDWDLDPNTGRWTIKKETDDKIVPYTAGANFRQWRETTDRSDDLCIACSEHKQVTQDGLCLTCDYEITKMNHGHTIADLARTDAEEDAAIEQRLLDISAAAMDAPVEGSPTAEAWRPSQPGAHYTEEQRVAMLREVQTHDTVHPKLNKLAVWEEAQADLNRQAATETMNRAARNSEIINQQIIAAGRREMDQRVAEADRVALGNDDDVSSQYEDLITTAPESES